MKYTPEFLSIVSNLIIPKLNHFIEREKRHLSSLKHFKGKGIDVNYEIESSEFFLSEYESSLKKYEEIINVPLAHLVRASDS